MNFKLQVILTIIMVMTPIVLSMYMLSTMECDEACQNPSEEAIRLSNIAILIAIGLLFIMIHPIIKNTKKESTLPIFPY